MRVSELFNLGQKKKVNRTAIILIVTGFLSILIAIFTVYGQYTGNYLISITKEAHRKGIAISETRDFENPKNDISFEPLSNLDNISEGWLDIEQAEAVDGQYYQEGQEYIAFTFYLKNTGDETININYQIKVIDDYKQIGNATMFRVRESRLVGDEFQLMSDNKYSKLYTNKATIASVNIDRFRAGEIRKFTFFVWFEGEHSTPEMMGGAIKFEWVFGITSALEGGESLDS